MIPVKNRRLKALKLPKNIEKLYKESKCRECAVVVTRMDFAKILGKFTKVKIQYVNSKTPIGNNSTDITTNSKTRSKTNGNGMVNRKTYNNDHSKDTKSKQTKEKDMVKYNAVNSIVKQSNKLSKIVTRDKNSNYNNDINVNSKRKQYSIIFTSPISNNKKENSKIALVDLLPYVDDSILPSEEWCIDYFPKSDEPKDDKVYDRIAAELEDLMNNGKRDDKVDDKNDDFPSIMDILNDNANDKNKPTNQISTTDIESNDVESMLLGKTNSSETPEPTPMDVDNTDVSNLIADVEQLNAIQPLNAVHITDSTDCALNDIENPHSPSILDEALQKGIEEHLPPGINTNQDTELKPLESTTENLEAKPMEVDNNEIKSVKQPKINVLATKADTITELVFKKTLNGQYSKVVTCPKSLNYKVELDGKSVEFVGAPEFISNLEDLQILLQIVNESNLKSLHVLQ